MNLTEQQERLAIEIAHALDDMDSIQWHRQMVVTYSEEYLRKKLLKVLSIPQKQVQTTRGAIYNSLVQKYGHRNPRA